MRCKDCGQTFSLSEQSNNFKFAEDKFPLHSFNVESKTEKRS